MAFSAAEFQIGKLQLAPVYVEATLVNGVLNLALSNTGIYRGKANGLLTLDVSGDVARQSLNLNLDSVRALPLLSEIAGFRELDGTMQGKIDVRTSGASQHTMMANLAGSVDLLFRDGEIRGINIAQMARNLTQSTLNGWHEDKKEKTDLTELSGLFKIAAGVATTDNLKLLGPLVRVNGTGNADVAAKTLQFKFDTKLVMSLEGQGGPDNPIGFGVPVMVTGKWDSPQIYPDVAGILDHPDAAYAKLHELGLGLFGNNGGTGGNSFLKDLGNLLNNKGGQAPAPTDKQPPPQDNQTKESQTIISKPNEPRPQDAKPEDTGPQDSKSTIDKILKDILGK